MAWVHERLVSASGVCEATIEANHDRAPSTVTDESNGEAVVQSETRILQRVRTENVLWPRKGPPSVTWKRTETF